MPQKALALDTPVATPTGWAALGEVGIGDTVFAGDGSPTTVRAVSPIFHDDTYRVTFSDHSSLVACGDHEAGRQTRAGPHSANDTRELEHGLAAAQVPASGVHPDRDPAPTTDPCAPWAPGCDGGSYDGRITDDASTPDRLDGLSPRPDDRQRRTVIGYDAYVEPVFCATSTSGSPARIGETALGVAAGTDGHRWTCELRAGKCGSLTIPALRDGAGAARFLDWAVTVQS
jgi:hypothetical protein